MTLEVTEPQPFNLLFQRQSGHGFLEFEALYQLSKHDDGRTLLSYSVECVPCPVFPMALVDRKMEKEVPKMLVAFRKAAVMRRKRRYAAAAAAIIAPDK